jgi:hypothetical protein
MYLLFYRLFYDLLVLSFKAIATAISVFAIWCHVDPMEHEGI